VFSVITLTATLLTGGRPGRKTDTLIDPVFFIVREYARQLLAVSVRFKLRSRASLWVSQFFIFHTADGIRAYSRAENFLGIAIQIGIGGSMDAVA
jgi:hypothetical protein